MNHERDKTLAILSSKPFKRLVKFRSRLRFGLSFMVLALHAFFVGGIAFYNQWFAQPLGDNSSTPRGIIFTVAIIVLLLALEYIYILASRKVVEPLQQQAMKEVIALD